MATRADAPEQRTIDVDVQDLETRGRTLHGYAAVYGAESDDLGGFTERIAPGAFADVLDADVRALLNHDPNQLLGRTRSGTLRLHDEQRGLRFEIDLPDSPLGENVRASVARGDIDGASFRFKVARDTWDGDLRTVESVKELKDITVATFGAYPAASAELRTRPNNPGTAQEAVMGNQPENENETTIDQPDDESRGLEIRTPSSLRVEERAQAPLFQGLADAFRSRGFPSSPASVSWDEFRTLTWGAGTVLTDLNPVRTTGVPLGYDTRWAYPSFPSVGVDSATTSVQYLRQASRTLAGTAVVRALDSVAAKPEVATGTELVSQQLQQIACIETNVPNITAAQPLFQSLVETDLRLRRVRWSRVVRDRARGYGRVTLGRRHRGAPAEHLARHRSARDSRVRGRHVDHR